LSVFAVAELVCSALALSLAGCDTPSSALPGDALGDYSVVGTLTQNTCGDSLGAEDPWKFTAQMALDGKTLYLDTQGDLTESAAVYGSVDSKDGTTATLSSVVTNNVDPDANGMAGPCNLTLSTSYALVLNDAAASKSFTGTATFDFAAATDGTTTSDCTDQLAAQGGKYEVLPCTTAYTLAAKRQ
jgi:hypothetical protein